MVKCNCGHEGSWASPISGSSGGSPVIWQSCTNPTHHGQALGRPVPAWLGRQGVAAIVAYEEERWAREEREERAAVAAQRAELTGRVRAQLAAVQPGEPVTIAGRPIEVRIEDGACWRSYGADGRRYRADGQGPWVVESEAVEFLAGWLRHAGEG
jgi:hypothetical protein